MGYPFTVDIGRARQQLGYAPQIGVDKGLDELAAAEPGARVVDPKERAA
jgi:nucleoside-diphosphate-sugar epimerase